MRTAARRTTAAFVSFTALALAACATPPPVDAPVAPVMVGGYASADLSDAGVKAAQSLAVDEIYKRNPTRGLVENVAAEQQVVAGLNYRFTIQMTGGATYRIVVYRDLQNTLAVTAYEKTA